MTRQEAIELLNNDAFKICMVQLRDPLVNACHEALCMAIEALKIQDEFEKIKLDLCEQCLNNLCTNYGTRKESEE